MKRLSFVFLVCLLSSGCDKWFTTSENVKSCTKILIRPFGIRVNGLSAKALSQVSLKITRDGDTIGFHRGGASLFSPDTDESGQFEVEGFYGTELIFKETMKVEMDSDGCHAKPIGRTYDCQEVSSSVRCSLIDHSAA